MSRRIEIILGPTGVGKTSYAISRALECGSPVISCDSRQIYKELCIGTAVPSDEELAAVKHYFIRTVPITENYTAGIYEAQAMELVNRLFADGHANDAYEPLPTRTTCWACRGANNRAMMPMNISSDFRISSEMDKIDCKVT